MLFSCRAALPGVVRICPCRSYRKEQVAICETCWRNNLHHWILKLPSSLISIDLNCDAIMKEDCPRHHDSVTPRHDPYNTEHRLFTLHWSPGALMAKNSKTIQRANFTAFAERSAIAMVSLTEFSCYKLQDIFSWFTDKTWKLYLKSYSYQRDQKRPFPSTLICISKIHQLSRKNSRNAAVNRAKKVYQWIFYVPMRSLLAFYPRVSL